MFSFRKYSFFSIVFGLLGFSLSAQTADKIEALLTTPAVTYAQAARFILEASEEAKTSDPTEAFNYALARKWLPKKASPDTTAQIEGVSLLFMRAFNLKGGLFYTIAKNPHYAYRELVYRAVIQGKSDPHMNVSGEQLLFITGRILSILENSAKNE